MINIYIFDKKYKAKRKNGVKDNRFAFLKITSKNLTMKIVNKLFIMTFYIRNSLFRKFRVK